MNEAELKSTPPPPRHGQQPLIISIFIGDNGLRSGWRFLLYAAAVFLLAWLSISTFGRFLHRGESKPGTPGTVIAGETILLFAAVVPAVVAAILEKRPWGVYGLPFRGRNLGRFALGCAVGFAALSLLLLLMHWSHGFSLGGVALHGGAIARYASLWGVMFLLVGITEEFLFRGYSQYTLSKGIGFWPAAILLSAGFGAIHLHNLGEDWIGALAAACVALVFVFTLWRSGSLWFAVGVHAAWDWAESFFYGVPDSGTRNVGTLFNPHFNGSKWITGGSVGPEGSVFVFVAIVAIALLTHLLYPKRLWNPQ